ncbi:MAG: ECF transporter S component [Clostridia bacterium]|nr:ECF transporter S component [Clostridia bacterium]
MDRNRNTVKIAVAAMFAALAFAATLLGKVVPNVAGFLSYDPKDAVVVIAGFSLGPWFAAGIALVVSLVEMLTVSTTGLWGLLMNVLSTCSFAIPAAFLYQKNRSRNSALTGLASGVLAMVLSMTLWNWLITPIYMGVPREVVVGMLLPTFIPFNLVKGGMNAALTLLLYKPLVSALRRMKLMPPSDGSPRFSLRTILVPILLLIAFVLAFLFLAGVLRF